MKETLPQNAKDENFDWNIDPHEKYPVLDYIRKTGLDNLLRVQFNDESLRDGLQGVEKYPTLDEMKKYVDLASQVGIEHMTVGIYSGPDSVLNKQTLELLSYMRNNSKISPIVAVRPLEEDLDFAEKCLQINSLTQITVFQGMSPIRLKTLGWEEGQVIENISKSISRLSEKGIPTIALTEDTSRTSPESVQRFIKAVVQSGAKRIAVTDTVGSLDPFGTFRIISAVKSMLIKEGSEVGIDFHNHNDRGLATANALQAINAGADRVHAVLYGVGERAGNAPLDIIIYNVNRMLRESGHAGKYDLSKIYEISKYYSEITGAKISPHTPLVGGHAFSTSVGIHADAEEKADDPFNLYSGVDSRELKREHDYQIGPMSGAANVSMWMKNHGYGIVDKKDPKIKSILTFAKTRNRVLTNQEIINLLNI